MTRVNNQNNNNYNKFSFLVYFTLKKKYLLRETQPNKKDSIFILQPHISTLSVINFLDFKYPNNWNIALKNKQMILTIRNISFEKEFEYQSNENLVKVFKDLTLDNAIKKYAPNLTPTSLQISNDTKMKNINQKHLYDTILEYADIYMNNYRNIFVNRTYAVETNLQRRLAIEGELIKQYLYNHSRRLRSSDCSEQ